MNNTTGKYDLEDRLIDYAVRIIKVSEQLPESKAGKHIAGQVLRSGTAPAPNYGEAQSAESSKDFIHKIKIALKELRESKIWLKIIVRAKLIQESLLESLIEESDELTAILFKSVDTAKKNMDTIFEYWIFRVGYWILKKVGERKKMRFKYKK